MFNILKFIKRPSPGKEANGHLRVIKTVRSTDSINKAIKDGYTPVIKKVEPSKKIQVMYALMRDKRTGKIIEISDTRDTWDRENFEMIIDETFYYPYHFKSPYAAYLLPPDIQINERVILEDLIEDYIGESWQSNSYRLTSSEAVWNGKEFEIDYKNSDANILFG